MPTRIDFDSAYGASTSVVSNAFDAGSGADRAVLAWVTCPFGETISGATITGGETLTQIATDNDGTGNYGRRYVFAKVGVTQTGSVQVTFAASAGGVKYGAVAAYSDTSSIRASITGSSASQGTTAGPTLPVTSANGDTVVMLGHDNERGTTVSANAPATAFQTAGWYGLEEGATTSSTTIDGTFAAGGAWSAGAASLVPSGPANNIRAASNYYRMMRSA